MSNPTNYKCPNNVASILTTDYRPRKQLYENIVDNNAHRLYLQQNAEKLMAENKEKFNQHMRCCACDKFSKQVEDKIQGYKCESGQQQPVGKPLNPKEEKEEEAKGLLSYFGL
jgi:hypothetical protein